MSNFLISKCEYCKNYDHKNDKTKNKLRCMVSCDDLQQFQTQQAFEYNRAVSNGNFDTEKQYEHGKEIFGSGVKK